MKIFQRERKMSVDDKKKKHVTEKNLSIKLKKQYTILRPEWTHWNEFKKERQETKIKERNGNLFKRQSVVENISDWHR